jgi:type III restriction enzyme
VVEYKGADRMAGETAKSNRLLGELWAEMSDGKCLFVMATAKDWSQISSLI